MNCTFASYFWLLAFLLVLGLIGRMDYDDQVGLAAATAEIRATAQTWAVTE